MFLAGMLTGLLLGALVLGAILCRDCDPFDQDKD